VLPGDWGVTLKNTTTDLLDTFRELKGIESDYAAARVIEVRQQTISAYRAGQIMSDPVALTVCRMIGKPPAPVLAQLAADRAEKVKHSELAKVWRDAAKQLGRKGR
jgi:hypothetical protein